MAKELKTHKRVGPVGPKGSASTLCYRWVWSGTTTVDSEVTCKDCLRRMAKEAL